MAIKTKDVDYVVDLDEYSLNEEEKTLFKEPTKKDSQAKRWFLTLNNPFWTEKDIEEAEKNLFDVGNTVYVENTHTVTTKVSSRPPMERTEKNAKLFEDILSCSRKYGLGEFEENSVTGGSDAAYTTIAGIPTVDDMGPLGGDYHTTDEWIDIPSLSGSAKIIAAYIVG